MKMNIEIDVSELFVKAQQDAIEDAEIKGDDYGGSYIEDFPETTLKDAVKDEIISQCVAQIENKTVSSAINRLALNPSRLDAKFDAIAKQNISQSIDKKVNEWIDVGVVVDGEKAINVLDVISKKTNTAIGNINSRYSETSLEQSLNKMTQEKVDELLANYDAQIKKQVDLSAQSIIQAKVAETLTETFVSLMKNPNNIALNQTTTSYRGLIK